jgi:signal transduction protein with GAF and PtsI domain
VTGRVRETLDINTVLQTAVRELGQAMEVNRVSVYLVSAEEDAG